MTAARTTASAMPAGVDMAARCMSAPGTFAWQQPPSVMCKTKKKPLLAACAWMVSASVWKDSQAWTAGYRSPAALETVPCWCGILTLCAITSSNILSFEVEGFVIHSVKNPAVHHVTVP